jgi:uncharacterized MAPEG superfamily protein
MSATAMCLVGLISWSIILTFMLLGVRGAAIMKGHAFAGFAQDGTDLGGFAHRVTRAHGNSLEWLVVPAALLVYALATGQTEVTDGLAMWVLYARVIQSIVHMASVSTPAVAVRGTMLTVQIVIWIIWMVKFA